MKTRETLRSARAFSMVEALIVIATIGVLTALAIPMIGGIQDATHQSMVKRSAQQAASVSAAATAAGIIHVFPQSSGGVEATLALLRQGVTSDDASTSARFSIDVKEELVPEVAAHLGLVYADGTIQMILVKP